MLTWGTRKFKFLGLCELDEFEKLDVRLFMLHTLDLRDPSELGLEGGLLKTHTNLSNDVFIDIFTNH